MRKLVVALCLSFFLITPVLADTEWWTYSILSPSGTQAGSGYGTATPTYGFGTITTYTPRYRSYSYSYFGTPLYRSYTVQPLVPYRALATPTYQLLPLGHGMYLVNGQLITVFGE